MWYSCGRFSCRNWLYHVRSAKQEKIKIIPNTASRKPKCFRELLVFLLLPIYLPVNSQYDSLENSRPSFSLGLSSQKGFIIPHSESIRSISYSHPWAMEINVAWHYSDSKSQSYCNCFPRLGVSSLYVNFDNPEILGHGFAISPYLEPFIPLGKNINLSIRFLAGVVYLDNIFNPISNPQNLFYSTNFSYFLSIDPVLNFKIYKYWNLRIAGNYNHISNGGNTHPNKGINFPTASIGLDYIFETIDFSKKIKSVETRSPVKNSFRWTLLGTLKLPVNELKKRKLLYGSNIVFGHVINRLSRLTAGLEYVHDGTLQPDPHRLSALGGHDLMIGRFIFSQQLGVYLYSPVKPMDPVFQRWGIDYYISKKFFIGANLKAHRHVADFLDFRIGYII